MKNHVHFLGQRYQKLTQFNDVFEISWCGSWDQSYHWSLFRMKHMQMYIYINLNISCFMNLILGQPRCEIVEQIFGIFDIKKVDHASKTRLHQLVPAMRQGWKTCCTPTNPSGVLGSCYPSPKRQFDSLTVAQLKEKAKEAWLNGPSCAVFGWWTMFAAGIYTWCILMYVEQSVRRGLAAFGMCTIPLNMLRNKGLWQVAPSRNPDCFGQGRIGATGGLF